jgi:4-amino-4-deoxy-L-arabinose transferase-like glycosyltransferase
VSDLSRPGVTAPPVRLAQAVFFLLLAIKLYVSVTAPPIGDEAYYWIWGQKLGWSYFDHPPLHAWLLRVMSVFGWNLLGLRILTWLTFAGTLWIFWDWAKRLKPENPGAWFWPSAAIYLASPLFFLMSTVAFHDHLLIFLCLASVHLFLRFAEGWEADGGNYRWLYAAAALLGLAVLTKYNGVLVGVGIALFFAARRATRPLFRSPHLYLAALLAIALQAPVFYWNLTEGFASYKFHLADRWTPSISQSGNHVLEFVLVALLAVGPFIYPAIGGMIRRSLGEPFADRARTMALCVFAVSTLAMAGISLVAQTYFYWNITGFLALMPLLAGWMRRRWVLLAHSLYGLLFAGAIAFNLTIVPLDNLRGGFDWTISSTFGWPAVAARVAEIEQHQTIGFVAATRYTTAAQLAFALHDPEVTSLAERPDQYHIWFDPAAHAGQDALIVSDALIGTAEIAGRFDSLTELARVPYVAWGRTIYEPIIYLGRNFHPH